MSAADPTVAVVSMRAAVAGIFVAKFDRMQRVIDAVHAAAAVASLKES